MLEFRLVTGLVLVSLFLGALTLDARLAPWYPCWLVLVVAAVIASTREVVGLLANTPARPSTGTVIGGSLAMVAANWAPHVLGLASIGTRAMGDDPTAPVHTLVWPLWVFVAVVMAAFLGAGLQYRRPGGTSATIAGTVLATTYIALFGSFLIQHRWLPDPSHGVVPLVLLIATCKGADTGAYALGRMAGRRKLWPQLSPNKTVEGSIGGLIMALVAALVTIGVARLALRVETLSWPATIGYGLLIGVAAQLGDLMESLVKRDCLKKDASDTLPGFGGVLDVLDSLLFAAPVAYGYWLVWGP
jgi:phosphatidate cytidylyltransferase